MTIEKIIKKNDVYSTIHFEDGEKLMLSTGLIMQKAIRKGDFINEELYQELVIANQLFKIKENAFRYLARRPHARFELKLKLIRKTYDEQLIDKILDELEAANYLDDYEFALAYIQEKAVLKKSGRMKIKSELFKKGVRGELIEKALEELDLEEDLLANAEDLALKKLASVSKKESDPFKLKQRVYSYLSGRGYEYEIIEQVIRKLDLDQ